MHMPKEELSKELLSPPRGTRDFLPEEKLLRDGLERRLEQVFQRFGFNPLETPAFERFEVLASKYAGGEEILKETYSFEDQGKRRLGLRYDLTVPLCRVVASNPSLAMPFKRYQIAPAWRDGPVKLARYRELVQCDVDIVGAASGIADAEVIAVACAALSELGFDYEIRVNNRKLLNGVLEWAGVPPEKKAGAILAVDKLAKTGRDAVEKELLEERDVPISSAKKIMEFILLAEGDADKVLEELSRMLKDSEEGKKGLTELMEVLDFLDAFGVRDKIVFSASLARGLSYYTGTVFEGYLKNSQIASSVCGGGRYDDLVGAFSGKPTPAVGISLGLEVLLEAVKLGLSKPLGTGKTVARVFVAPIKTLNESIKVAQQLRAAGIAASLDLLERGVSKNLDYASKQGIPFVAIVGPREAKEGKMTLRNMVTGEEKVLTVEQAVEAVINA
ncbi:MAG: histidine--tRNA ligase [Candidatus Micrarchaeota archaeon]